MKFRRAMRVQAAPERAWEVVGDLAGVGRWIPGITDVRVQGMERTYTFAAGGSFAVQHETISNYSTRGMSFDYDIRGGPLPAKASRGRFAVAGAKDGGRGSQITWEHELEPLDPAQGEQVARMWEGAMDRVAESLRRLVESPPAT